jgi:hypothetical protein
MVKNIGAGDENRHHITSHKKTASTMAVTNQRLGEQPRFGDDVRLNVQLRGSFQAVHQHIQSSL